MTKLKSNYILDLVNDITLIHNSIQKGELFSAGFNLCFLQQCLLDVMRELEEREKNEQANPREDKEY